MTLAFARSRQQTTGNFWVDLTRARLYVMMAHSIVVRGQEAAVTELQDIDPAGYVPSTDRIEFSFTIRIF
ncbi:MAG: potassium-transporting ATPase subunit KdpA [Hyphomicrobium sp.]